MNTFNVTRYLIASMPPALPRQLAADLAEATAPVVIDAVADPDATAAQCRRRVSLAARGMLVSALAVYMARHGVPPVELIGAVYDSAERCGNNRQ